MKASELRIGNYIHYIKTVIPCTIDTIYAVDKIVGESIMYTPVPITEQWLLDFGFKQLDKYTFVKDKWFVYHRKRGFVTSSKQKELKFNSVHELQNWWFGNTKKELELKK